MPKPKLTFFTCIGIIGLLAVHIGFAKTYISPVLKGTFKAPTVIYLHGAFAFAWVALFLIQSLLVSARRVLWHKRLGIFTLFVAIGICVTMIPVGKYQVQRELAEGFGDTAISSYVGIVTTLLLFVGFVAAGYFNRAYPEVHKRLLLLATIILLWPAWFRFRHYFPSVPRPDIWFGVVLADSLILIAWVWDRIKNGGIHPVLLYGGLFVIAEHVFEILTFDTAAWRSVAMRLYSIF